MMNQYLLMLCTLCLSSLPASSFAVAETGPALAHLVLESHQRALHEHEQEFEIGKSIFGSTAADEYDKAEKVWEYTNDDFESYDIGRGNYGPLSCDPKLFQDNCHQVFAISQPVLTVDDCEYLIHAAQQAIAVGRQQDAQAATSLDRRGLSNSDLGEARLSTLHPQALKHLRHLLNTRLYPLLQSRFGTQTELTLYDGLILGNIAPAKSQPVHRDASILTLNIPLSSLSDFEGGGTYVEPLDEGFGAPLKLPRGHALCHFSGVRHAGSGITSGQRWVLVMFMLARQEPQLARRSHAAGLEAMDQGDLDAAKACFTAGLEAAPADHLLHLSMGSIASAANDKYTSYQSLVTATKHYPLDRKAVIAKGNMLLAQSRRPRAALRQFEILLDDIADRDHNTEWMPLKALAWETRIAAARACMLCAEREAAEFPVGQRPWAAHRMPQAIEWLKTALIPAPQDGRLHALLKRAQELLSAAETLEQQPSTP